MTNRRKQISKRLGRSTPITARGLGVKFGGTVKQNLNVRKKKR